MPVWPYPFSVIAFTNPNSVSLRWPCLTKNTALPGEAGSSSALVKVDSVNFTIKLN